MVVIIVFVLGSDSSGMWVVLGSTSLVWILLLMTRVLLCCIMFRSAMSSLWVNARFYGLCGLLSSMVRVPASSVVLMLLRLSCVLGVLVGRGIVMRGWCVCGMILRNGGYVGVGMMMGAFL